MCHRSSERSISEGLAGDVTNPMNLEQMCGHVPYVDATLAKHVSGRDQLRVLLVEVRGAPVRGCVLSPAWWRADAEPEKVES